jgi:tetratricopeptide (TPR) repeat protein
VHNQISSRLLVIVCLLGLWLVSTAGNCSRARVESMTKMNEGVSYAQQNRWADAAQALEQAGMLDPTNSQAYYNLAMAQLELQKPNAARDALDKAIAASPETAAFYEKLGYVKARLDPPDYDGAMQAFERAIELEPTLFRAYFQRARILEEQQKYQQALEEYTRGIQAGPRYVEAYAELGRLYADLGYTSEAAQTLSEGIRVAIPATEEEAHLHYLLGTIYQESMNYQGAIEEYKTALRIIPSMAEVLFSLGWCFAEIDERDEAKRYLRRFMEAAGPDSPAHVKQAAQNKIAQLGG